ncbi:MAG: hypothetical protein IRF12RH_02960 [Rickettsia helvetica]|uniref:Uncharacterized protein n=2 Tax=Rickettsia helvetica TaxID=35789 RepID=A0ABP0T4J3_RICHE|nr:hypothetical protein [Rickettsia helvetica]
MVFFRFSWKDEERGMQEFSDPKYHDKLCTRSKNTKTPDDLTNYLLFIFHEICKVGKETCIEGFLGKHPHIVNIAEATAPELFVNESAINICFKEDIARQNATKAALQLKSSDQFFRDCFIKVFPNLDYNKYFQILNIEYNQEDGTALISFNFSNADGTSTNDDVLPTGNLEDNNH